MVLYLYVSFIISFCSTLCFTAIKGNQINRIELWRSRLESSSRKLNLANWQNFLEFKVQPGESSFVSVKRLDGIIYKLQSANENFSENPKLAEVLKGLPKEFDSFKAAVQFQTLAYKELKDKIFEKLLLSLDKLQQVDVRLEPTM